jgi:pimeloyl-ACP methyl ester carboxylesterase
MMIATMVAAIMLAAPAQAGRDGFVSVNGVRLHYVDWGGRGPIILFLIGGGGGSAHTFDTFAPRFTNRFQVLGLTRRGQGPSDRPPSGYDTDTLAQDIRAFLDKKRIEQVILIGHSIAGAEMTRFAVQYPERVSKLVYLDSALDYARLDEIAKEAGFEGSPADTPIGKIERGAAAAHPDFSKIKAPALAFVVVYEEPLATGPQDDAAYKRYLELMFEKRFWLEISRTFTSSVPNGRVIQLHNTNHNFFKDARQVDRVVQEIETFLLRERGDGG